MYPLKFIPIVKDKIWGGDKLEKLFGKNSGDLANIGESWELSGYPTDISIVANGNFAGKTLQDLMDIYKEQLLGKKVYERFGSKFPLLFKLIDSNDDLSIQVHPNDEIAGKRHNSFGKTEMWYVMYADVNAYLIIGFKENCTKEQYMQALEKDEVEKLLQKVPVNAGDVFFIPAGLVHAIGKGVVVAEIQESSDITYRIYDYKRKDSQGNERELHTSEALDVINFHASKHPKKEYSSVQNEAIELVDCEYFTTNLLELDKTMKVSPDAESFIVYMCVEGGMEILYGISKVKIEKGETVMIPAFMTDFQLIPNENVKLLEIKIRH